VPEIWPSLVVSLLLLFSLRGEAVALTGLSCGGTWMERCQEITANALVSIYQVVCAFSLCVEECVCLRGVQ